MARIFASLALSALMLLLASLVLGFRTGDFNEAARQYQKAGERYLAAQRSEGPRAPSTEAARAQLSRIRQDYQPVENSAQLHRVVGITAALVTLLVNSVSITYFIGTSRWCREVVDAYGFDESLALRGMHLKRKTFPWSLLAIVTILAVSAIGAAGDPGFTDHPTSRWVWPHLVTSVVGTLVIAFAFAIQISNIAKNYALIEEITGLVQQKRAEL